MGQISNLCIYHDAQLDSVVLLIPNSFRDQWQLLLEKPNVKYIYPLNFENSLQHSSSQEGEVDNDESKNFPTARSRLRGLKQLSVEKLVIIKQRLAESRNRNFESSILHQGC